MTKGAGGHQVTIYTCLQARRLDGDAKPTATSSRQPARNRPQNQSPWPQVAYMDPGNWAVSIEAGSRFGYQLVGSRGGYFLGWRV